MLQEYLRVLAADAARARILESTPGQCPWRELMEETRSIANPLSREQGRDRPGQVFESIGPTRHVMQPRRDPHKAAKLDFARALAFRLEVAGRPRRFQGLFLVAPPGFLGALRSALGSEARRRLAGTLDHDLTRQPLAQVVQHMEEAGLR